MDGFYDPLVQCARVYRERSPMKQIPKYLVRTNYSFNFNSIKKYSDWVFG